MRDALHTVSETAALIGFGFAAVVMAGISVAEAMLWALKRGAVATAVVVFSIIWAILVGAFYVATMPA